MEGVLGQRSFRELIEGRWAEGKRVCVGLDSEPRKIPFHLKIQFGKGAVLAFNHAIINKTHDLVAAYKPNMAFYEAFGEEGFLALSETIKYVNRVAPSIPVILDAKRADIGNTNLGYLAALDLLGADAITVHPYLGGEALQPFLDDAHKGVFVLCRTSNPGASEFQDYGPAERPLYVHLADRFANTWNKKGNVGLVVGATYPDEIGKVRSVAPEVPLLIPGVGAQGGDLEKTVKAAKDNRGAGFIINSSRGIIYASDRADFADAARHETEKLHQQINSLL